MYLVNSIGKLFEQIIRNRLLPIADKKVDLSNSKSNYVR